ncbi:hypothetical protein [Paragemmobacter straminiformis]|uniref:Uncharacterized protein n=1 Tax=Paragemmobacter straminiformis TaxID=2045119 RepID=A0A842IA20_9RHOB|nr:hypothetical protein [Gemmobacter straminiformis]MBC2836459.1 hypothetical protein [Gemmobacter straminiformis]
MDDAKFNALYASLASRGASAGELLALAAQHAEHPAMDEKSFAEAFIRPVMAKIAAREQFFKEAQLGRQIMGRPMPAKAPPKPPRPAAAPRPATEPGAKQPMTPDTPVAAPPRPQAPPQRPVSAPSDRLEQFAQARTAAPQPAPPFTASPITAPPPPNPFEAAYAKAKDALESAEKIIAGGSLGARSAEVGKAFADLKAEALARSKDDGKAAMLNLQKLVALAEKINGTRTLAARPAPPPASPNIAPPPDGAPKPQRPADAAQGAQTGDDNRKKYEAAAQRLVPDIKAARALQTPASGALVGAAVRNMLDLSNVIGAAVAKGDYATAQGQLGQLANLAAAVGDAAKLEARQRAARDAQRKESTTAVTAVLGSLDTSVPPKDMANKLQEAGKAADTDFGKAMRKIEKRARSHDRMMKDYTEARSFAQKYLADHPRKGKVKDDETEKRRKLAELAIATTDKWFADQVSNRKKIEALCTRLSADAGKGDGPVAIAVLDDLQKIIDSPLVPQDLRDMASATADKIVFANRLLAPAALASAKTDPERGKTLLEHARFKRTDGGTSDVKLLTEDDGRIAYAFKSVEGESDGGLRFLGLGKGASTLREVVSSKIHDAFAQAGLDFGFPKTILLESDGKHGALIEGIKGKMVDPEEHGAKAGRADGETDPVKKAVLDAEVADSLRTMNTLPEKVSPDSMQNVILSQMLTCQWDCKWGNLIIDGDRARPIDAGTAIPTRDVVKEFAGGAPPAFKNLLTHPDKYDTAKFGTPLPHAAQPFPAAKIKAIKDLDVEAIIEVARKERDAVIKSVPGMDASLMDESCFDIMRDSINAVKAILTKKPDQTLEQFVAAYTDWFEDYSAKALASG